MLPLKIVTAILQHMFLFSLYISIRFLRKKEWKVKSFKNEILQVFSLKNDIYVLINVLYRFFSLQQ